MTHSQSSYHYYKRPIRKVYDPCGWDRFDPLTRDIPDRGQIVHVVGALGPFRVVKWTTPDGKNHYGNCGYGSLKNVSARDERALAS